MRINFGKTHVGENFRWDIRKAPFKTGRRKKVKILAIVATSRKYVCCSHERLFDGDFGGQFRFWLNWSENLSWVVIGSWSRGSRFSPSHRGIYFRDRGLATKKGLRRWISFGRVKVFFRSMSAGQFADELLGHGTCLENLMRMREKSTSFSRNQNRCQGKDESKKWPSLYRVISSL